MRAVLEFVVGLVFVVAGSATVIAGVVLMWRVPRWLGP